VGKYKGWRTLERRIGWEDNIKIEIWDRMMWTVFMWFRTCASGELLKTMEGCQFHMKASVPYSEIVMLLKFYTLRQLSL
jgi:hypothetical protein